MQPNSPFLFVHWAQLSSCTPHAPFAYTRDTCVLAKPGSRVSHPPAMRRAAAVSDSSTRGITLVVGVAIVLARAQLPGTLVAGLELGLDPAVLPPICQGQQPTSHERRRKRRASAPTGAINTNPPPPRSRAAHVSGSSSRGKHPRRTTFFPARTARAGARRLPRMKGATLHQRASRPR